MNSDDIVRLDWSRVFPTAIRLGLSAAQTTLECCYSTGVWICISRSCSGTCMFMYICILNFIATDVNICFNPYHNTHAYMYAMAAA